MTASPAHSSASAVVAEAALPDGAELRILQVDASRAADMLALSWLTVGGLVE